jgi:hypothetical protein
VPCRHLTATFYALADSFDQDPFGILTWRGRGREELLDHLRVLRSQPEPENNQAAVEKPRGFWTAGPRLALPPQGPHGRPDAVLDLLEPLDLTAGRYQVTDLLRRAYRVMASEAGAEAAEDTVD